MFGFSFEKLIIVGVVAAFLIGPERLPHYASVLAKFVRQLREFTNGAKTRMKEEMGPDFDEVEWKKLDPRQYDPRRIIRDALLDDSEPETVKPSAPMAPAGATVTASVVNAADPGFDDGPGVSLSVPAAGGSGAQDYAPEYLSGKKSAARGAVAAALPFDTEAT